MKRQLTLRCARASVLFLAFALLQETWTLAGVTGNLNGIVRDTAGAPIAGARVQAVSPSQTAVTTSDSTGHFLLLSLAPDTYTLNLSRSGYQPVSFSGNVVFADQTQVVSLTMSKALMTIGHVTSQAGASLVKSGIGGDLYSVNATQVAAAAALGGAGNLNNAYSAMASVPGVQTSPSGAGWLTNAAYVRGQNAYYTGYEYDGIPINRAFDNYNSSTESTLGLQELQVYTGGGPSSVASSGTSGFINQVIKTGTFPGFATANIGIGTPFFYHQAAVEIAGSTPDRTFSYYVGLSGNNQAFGLINSDNGESYMTPGDIFSGNAAVGLGIGYGFGSNQILSTGYTCLIGTCQGVKPVCPMVGQKWNQPVATFGQQGCWQYYAGLSGLTSAISERENVVNLHMGIPHGNGLRDDLQLLWSGSALNNYSYLTPDAVGPGNGQFIYSLYNTNYRAPTCGPETVAPGLNVNGCSSVAQIVSLESVPSSIIPPCNPATGGPGCAPTYLAYADGIAYNLPFGTTIAKSASSIKAPSVYMAPDTPSHAFQGPIPLNDSTMNVNQNDTGIVKLQYTHALSQSAYLRAYGYSFYSDWFENAPFNGATGLALTGFNGAAQYQLMTHTIGGALDFQDQLNDQNLLTLDGNYTTAGITRLNNNSAILGSEDSPIGYMAPGANGQYTCYDPTHGTPEPCVIGTSGANNNYYDTSLSGVSSSGGHYNCAVKSAPQCFVMPTWNSTASVGPTGFGGPAKATWDSLWSGNVTGSLNTVRPRFTNASLTDQFRPNDKFLVNGSLRYDNFTYELPDSMSAADSFYAGMTANYTCVLAATNQVLTVPLAAGGFPPAPAQFVSGNCDQAAAALHLSGPHTGWVHPNGTTQNGVAAPNFTAASPGSYALDYWQPRISATYTQSPDTVFRFSAGRFTQPPISASVQYLSPSGDDRSVWNSTMNLGFYSPFHPIPGVSSSQYDASVEHHFRNTDVSLKLSPFYTWVNDWQQQTFIGAGFATQVPVGFNRIYGAEFQVNKGDFSRNGFSGQLAFTYTNSKVQFQNVPLITGGVIPNTTTTLNQVISGYNALTKAGGGSPCYQGGKAVSCNTGNGKIVSGFDTILNPYYNQPAQPLLNPNGWYNPYTTAVAPNVNGAYLDYISPEIASLILSYRKNKFAITPSFTFQAGGSYGTPMDVSGLDPRTCQLNSAGTGITKLSPKTNPLQCNYLTTTSAGSGPFVNLYIPDPQTGSFGFGSYQNPNFLVGNLQIEYDLTPKIRLSLLGANLFHACFGGSSEPWTSANPPGANTCGYVPAGSGLNSTLYPSNFYNGTGINDFAANKARTPAAFQQSYLPNLGNNGAIGGVLQPFNIYFNAQVKI
ncbi:MAG TPA: TonB-dependent receptor [Candidatus Cybelea sp.]|jgi:hypothetical protein